MQQKTERFEMRLEADALERVDAWRGRQDDVPSRAEAMRRLMDSGLSLTSSSTIRFSASDKLILTMLRELYEHLEIEGDIDPKFVGAVLNGGHFWGLKWKYPGLYHDHEDNPIVVSEVVNILDMWSFIEWGYAKCSKKDKERIEKEVEFFGKNVSFPGFDGNYESGHLSVAEFLINDLERFSSFKGRDLNSHAPLLDAYRRMLKVFEPIRATLVGGDLNATRIIALLNESMHPSRRPS